MDELDHFMEGKMSCKLNGFIIEKHSQFSQKQTLYRKEQVKGNLMLKRNEYESNTLDFHWLYKKTSVSKYCID